jgi:hypothetical protein
MHGLLRYNAQSLLIFGAWIWVYIRVRELTATMYLGFRPSPLCPMSDQGSPEALLKLQMAPRLILWMSLGSKKKEPRSACLSEAKASHLQRIGAEVSSITPHFLHNGLSTSPSRERCLLRVLWPVSRPITALVWVLLKDITLVFAPRLDPEINYWACLWVSPRLCHLAHCWLANQQLSLFCMSRLEAQAQPQVPRTPDWSHPLPFGACSSAVNWGTALKAGRSWVQLSVVSLEFLIDIMLPLSQWPWSWLSL